MTTFGKQGKSGFTLIETLVAFIILGLAAGAIMSVLQSSPAKVLRADNERLAVLSAKSMLSLVGTELPLQPDTRQGKLENGVKWTISIQPYGEASDHEKDDSIPQVTIPYLVTVTAVIGPVWNPAKAIITTLRLKPAAS